MIPVIKKLYEKEEQQSQALKRHLELFHTTPAMAPSIMGITTTMEEQSVNDPNFDESSISAIKTSFMGPFTGIGDSLFWELFES